MVQASYNGCDFDVYFYWFCDMMGFLRSCCLRSRLILANVVRRAIVSLPCLIKTYNGSIKHYLLALTASYDSLL